MDFGGVSAGELAMLAGALVAGGLVAGFLAGMLGIGGGGVLVPVLYEIFGVIGVEPDVRMHAALGTTMAVILPTALKAFSGHRARGAADMALLKRAAPFVVLGVIAGVMIAKAASGTTLKWVWVVVSSIVAIKMALGREDWRLGDHLPGRPWPQIVATGIGLLSTLMSIGGASFTVPLLTLYGYAILPAVATASGVGPLIAFPGVIGYAWAGWGEAGLPPFSLGYVNLIGLALVAPLSVFAAPFGVRLAHGIPRRTLELAFAVFLACVSTRFLIDLLG